MEGSPEAVVVGDSEGKKKHAEIFMKNILG